MSNNQQPTTIRVSEGTNLEVVGGGTVRVLVVQNATGDVRHQEVPAGTPIREVVGNCHGHVSCNGAAVQDLSTPVQHGDKISVTPENVEGN